jgi:hypothetical protein
MHSLAWAAKGPLDTDRMQELVSAFQRHDQGWNGQV